ncbi:minor capsid protein [Microviridae sp.]|nr:minor capsid protein [Microviridae sp.]
MNPLIAAGLISGGADLLGGFFGQSSAKRESARNRAFQERMARYAHTYEVEDLRRAGLNPVLSAGGSGAATPSGSMANVGANVIGDAVNSGMAAARTRQELEVLKSQDTKNASDAKAAEAAAAAGYASAKRMNAETNILNLQAVQERKNAEAAGGVAGTVGAFGKAVAPLAGVVGAFGGAAVGGALSNRFLGPRYSPNSAKKKPFLTDAKGNSYYSRRNGSNINIERK